MGTPDFAVPSLDILLKNGYDVVGVITATDKYGGRKGKKLIESAVKKYAVEKGLNILQPKNLRSRKFQAELKALNADLQIVVAFRMLPIAVWSMPPIGTVNLHGSLLPKYRGAAPLNWAVINGEKETGATTFFLKHKIDTGDLLFTTKVEIGEETTVGEIHDELMIDGAELILKTVQTIESGEYTATPQDESLVSEAPKIFDNTCEINFDQPTQKVHDFIRGLSPYPTAWTMLDGKKLKVYRAKRIFESHDYSAGKVVSDNKHYLRITTQDGFMDLLEIHLQGRKRMDIKSFLNGYKVTL